MSFPLNASEAAVALGRPDLPSGHVRDDVGHEEAIVTEVDLVRAAALQSEPGYGWDDIDDFGVGVRVGSSDDDVDAGPLPWQEQALCAQTDPEAFFPEKGGSTREAKRVCSRCEVRGDCLSFALAHDERFGIWGGLSERERRRLKRRAG